LARQAINNPESPKPLNLERHLEESMVSMMAPPLEESKTAKRRTIALVGPTGSGKTTTLAKMAADAALKKRKKVAVISTDTYRIGAVEQLRIYAKIIGVPLLIAGTPKELANAVARNQEADFIFVDTTGRSPQDAEQDAELREQLKGLRGLETHLVLSATAKDRDLWESIRRFWPVSIDSLIFTRLDETKEVGTLFNQAVRSRKPLSYFSTGQRVPEDLEAANPRRLARMILRSSSESTG
jgi:flagellar biosynthesis protein FlhF